MIFKIASYYTGLTSFFIFYNMLLASCQAESRTPGNTAVPVKAYHFSNTGDDNNDGSSSHPWKSISRIKTLVLNAGDSVLLAAGQTFSGTLVVNYNTNGTSANPVVISSYGTGMATINSGNEAGVIINNSSYLQLQNIQLRGAGRKEGNTTSGISIAHSSNIQTKNIEVSGYQKSGLSIRNCSNMIVDNVFAHENGYAGIAVDGDNFLKTDCRNIEIKNCRAENNPGDPTRKDNHSGNGIIVSQSTNLKISYCTATNNGWDMPRIGNGPVGIWAWEVDSVTIEHCLSYRNKTSKGGEDGGGFDFDGGVTNSIIQYCLSFENEGSGIGLFQYDKATVWENNTVRYNVSINDGSVSAAKAGIYIWSANADYKLTKCQVYNNTIYNDKNPAISFAPLTFSEGLVFYNNILVGKKEIISGSNMTGQYTGNCWWSIDDGFNVSQLKDFTQWRIQKQQETWNGTATGLNTNPGFSNMQNMTLSNAGMLSGFQSVKAPGAAFVNGGVDIGSLFGILTGGIDFNGHTAPL
jgi:hypothetical protein